MKNGKGRKSLQKDIIIKSNDLVESSFFLSLNQQKILLLIIANLDQFPKRHQEGLFDEKLLMIEISFNEIIQKIFNNNIEKPNIHTYILKILQSLKNKSIILKGDKEDEYTGWILKFRHLKNKSKIIIFFDPTLEPFLLNLKGRFTQYYFQNIVQFKFTYSFRIYEICKQYLFLEKRSLEIDSLKKYLGIENKYKKFSDFIKRVIEPAIKEITNTSDIKISYSIERKERRIPTNIEFKILSKQKKVLDDSEIAKRLKALKLKPQYIQKVLDWFKDCVEILEQKVATIENKSKENGIEYISAYSMKVLNTAMATLPQELKDKKLFELKNRLSNLKDFYTTYKNSYDHEEIGVKNKIIAEIINKLSETELEKMLSEIENTPAENKFSENMKNRTIGRIKQKTTKNFLFDIRKFFEKGLNSYLKTIIFSLILNQEHHRNFLDKEVKKRLKKIKEENNNYKDLEKFEEMIKELETEITEIESNSQTSQ